MMESWELSLVQNVLLIYRMSPNSNSLIEQLSFNGYCIMIKNAHLDHSHPNATLII